MAGTVIIMISMCGNDIAGLFTAVAVDYVAFVYIDEDQARRDLH